MIATVGGEGGREGEWMSNVIESASETVMPSCLDFFTLPEAFVIFLLSLMFVISDVESFRPGVTFTLKVFDLIG